MKKCNCCKTEKPITDFLKRFYTYDGLESKCKECLYKVQKEYRDKKKQERASDIKCF